MQYIYILKQYVFNIEYCLIICQKTVFEVAFEIVYNALKILKNNAVSGPAVAQWWPTSYILPPVANGGPLASCYLGSSLELFSLLYNKEPLSCIFQETPQNLPL